MGEVTSDLFVILFRTLQGPVRLDLGVNKQNVDFDFNQNHAVIFNTGVTTYGLLLTCTEKIKSGVTTIFRPLTGCGGSQPSAGALERPPPARGSG